MSLSKLVAFAKDRPSLCARPRHVDPPCSGRSDRWRRLSAIGSLLVAAATTSTTAAGVEILISSHSASVATPCPSIANCLDIAVTGVSNDFAGLASPIPDSWSFALNYRLIGAIGSGNWSYTDLGPAGNNLFGSSMHVATPYSPSILKDVGQLTILGGGGLFAGASGSGQWTAYIDTSTGFSVDSTSLSVTLAPEPSTSALMTAGLVVAAISTRRRRR